MKWMALLFLLPIALKANEILSLNKSLKNKGNDVSFSKAEFKYINDIMSKTSPSDFNDLKKLLKQISITPAHKDPKTGIQLFKVMMVEKGSIFEKAGLKVGDLVANGGSI